MRYVIGIGSNIGDRKENIERAIAAIETLPKTRIVLKSSIYETQPVGYEEQDDFYNICLEVQSVFNPFEMIGAVLGIEAGETPTDKLRQFVAQKGLSYTVAPTQDSAMYGMGLIYGVPTTFIVNPQGKVVKTHMGAISAAQLQRYIRSDKKDNNVADKCKNNRNEETC